MSHSNLTYEDLVRIVELIKSSERFSEFRLKVGDIEVELRRRVPASSTRDRGDDAPRVTPATGQVPSELPPSPRPGVPPASNPGPAEWPEGSVAVVAPMMGTFYRAPEPGGRPFVEVGQAVEADAIVCIIEVMKLMNSIPAGVRGIVTHLLVDDAGPVETGQPLIVLGPDPDGCG